MSSWAERVHRRAADLGNVVTSCGHPGSGTGTTYPYRLEKVKFGVPLEEVCKNNLNIPGPLLVLILKLNKESPNRRDVFRAPGHQGAMKKLIHFLQSGRLVNVDNYSVYTIASVLKKFLRKIPNGIFGLSGEKELFAIIELENELEQCDRLHRLLTSLPIYTQHLLVLLFGTFRVIASNAAHAGTGMTSEALGVSVAPSFFQSCVSDGKTARMEDVLKFKVATKIMKHIIDKFATHDLFGRDNYEYYARVTGRILKVQDEWICSFQHPPPPREKLAQQKYALQHSLEAEKTWLQCQCERWGLLAQEESRSTPALLTSSSSALDNSVLSLGVTPEHSFIESCARLSVSLEGPGLFALSSSPIPKRNTHDMQQNDDDIDDDEENYADDDEDDFAAELEISNDDDIENKPKKQNIKMKKSRKSAVSEGATAVVEYDDIDDNGDDDDIAIVKRRYRQNKKKMTTTATQMRVQHQRRLRVGSKSLDERCNMGVTSTPNEKSSGSVAKSKDSNAHMIAVAVKTRNCSRCNRGIRHHSSSCSSTGGGVAGAAANGSGMTMEELRAVNRYAESTKSLSYLPQVHERQTARMRTRSEWFLGPKDGLTLQLPNTCSNCCLVVNQQQQQQYDDYQNQQRYLGGGSTRDMRPHCTDFGDDDEDDEVAGSAFYMYHKKRQQQLQQQKQYLQPEHMDTDESFDYETHLHSTAMQRRAFLVPQQVADVEKSNNAFAAIGGGNRRLFADTNSGSYVASNTSTINSTNNSYNKNYHDITTTTTTTTSCIDSNIYNNHNYIPNSNNNSNNNNINYTKFNNNSSNKENNSSLNYTLSNRQHLMKVNKIHSKQKRTSLDLSNMSSYNSNSNSNSNNNSNHNSNRNSNNNNNVKYIPQMHAQTTKTHTNTKPLCNSHYYSTGALHYDDHDDVSFVGADGELVVRGYYDDTTISNCINSNLANTTFLSTYTKTPNKLYHSPRKQTLSTRANSASELNCSFSTVNTADELNFPFATPNVTNTSINNTAPTSLLHQSISGAAIATDAASTAVPVEAEEVDYVFTSRFRHSTPMSQRRHLNSTNRQRLRSDSSSASHYQSLNSTLQAHNRSAGSNVSGSNGGRHNASNSGNNNFVTVIFNVLDFLF